MWNDCLFGYVGMFWAIISPTVGVQVRFRGLGFRVYGQQPLREVFGNFPSKFRYEHNLQRMYKSLNS